MSSHAPNQARVIPLRPATAPQAPAPAAPRPAPAPASAPDADAAGRPTKEPLWRDVVGDVLRRERLAQARTLKDVAEAARISMPYLSELERGRKEASSEVLAAAARALGLGLADLLALAQRELAHLAARRVSAPGVAAPNVTSRHRLASRTHRPAGQRPGDVRLAIAA